MAEQLRADVARAVRKVCPRWLADEADDLTQVATARVLGRLRATDNRGAYTAGYLYRAAHSALVDEIRRRRRLREVPIEAGLPARAEADDPEQQARAREIRDALLSCLARLAVPRRRAVMLHLQGHSVAEAGALLACDRKKAENLIYRGLADLRTCLVARGVSP
jgi:RNA polymerase sigma-70 factor (ECF subfamily)